MKMTKLAFLNFKNSFKSYLSLIISLAFAILVLYNFQNIIYSETFAVLGDHNKQFIDIIVRTISFVLGCFLFFFIWYSTNVFLTKRKREIGIYIFMGLSNSKIGKLYVLEAAFIAFFALAAGIVLGMLTSGLFQMLLLAVSDIAVEIKFGLTYEPVVITAVVFLVLYGIFMLKGYFNIVRSSVLNMISAMRQNEYVRQNRFFLSVKTVLGVCVLGSGYYYAVKEGGMEVMGHVFMAVVFVTCGVYLLFGGMLPLIFRTMAEKKQFLYNGQRCLWVNQVVFRMKKNYRTYAIVCIMLLCSATALATGFAMKNRYENMVLFDNTYTFQLLGTQTDPEEKENLRKRAEELITGAAELSYQNTASVVGLEGGELFAAYSEVERLAKEAGMEFELEKLSGNELIEVNHIMLLSILTQIVRPVEINGEQYQQIGQTMTPYFGYLQKEMQIYIVSDEEYERLKEKGQEFCICNYKIADNADFYEAREALDSLVGNPEESGIGRVAVDPNSNEDEWVKVLYSLCIFMALVFIVAGTCIMFMRLYNDAFEEKERYAVMCRLGFEERVLKKSIRRELGTAYVLPFAVMAVSAYFAVHALEKMMYTTLFPVYVMSLLIVLGVFLACYLFQITVYERTLMRY